MSVGIMYAVMRSQCYKHDFSVWAFFFPLLLLYFVSMDVMG